MHGSLIHRTQLNATVLGRVRGPPRTREEACRIKKEKFGTIFLILVDQKRFLLPLELVWDSNSRGMLSSAFAFGIGFGREL
jgi:hypothetical protein